MGYDGNIHLQMGKKPKQRKDTCEEEFLNRDQY